MRLRNLNPLYPLVLTHSRRYTTCGILWYVQQTIRQQQRQRQLQYSGRVYYSSNTTSTITIGVKRDSLPKPAEQASLRKNAGIHRLPHAALSSYLTSYSTSDEDVGVANHHRGLREATVIHFPRTAHQAVSPLQGRMLRTLASIAGAKRILELGCFTGQSALWLADGAIQGARRRGMDPTSVEVVTCERDEAAAIVARDWIAQAKLERQITVILGQADTT